MKKISGNKSELFTNCTQETAAAYLKARYGLPKKFFISLIQLMRDSNDIFITHKVKEDYLTFSLNSNKTLAYFAISKAL